MKKLIIITMLFVSITAHSQECKLNRYEKIDHRNHNIKVNSLIMASIVLNATGDGANLNGKKTLGHTLNAFSIACLLAIPVVTNIENKEWYRLAAKYAFIRFGIFDPIINTTLGVPPNHIANSSLTDRLMREIDPSPTVNYTVRSIFFIAGVAIPLDFDK